MIDDTVMGRNFAGSLVPSSFGISDVLPAHSSVGQQPAYNHRLKSEINSPLGMLDMSDSFLPSRPGAVFFLLCLMAHLTSAELIGFTTYQLGSLVVSG